MVGPGSEPSVLDGLGQLPLKGAYRSIEDIIPAPTSNIALAGRVMLHRSFGKICFATINDGTGKIQILFSRENCSIHVDGISHAELVSASSNNS